MLQTTELRPDVSDHNRSAANTPRVADLERWAKKAKKRKNITWRKHIG